MIFSERLKELRQEHGLRQNELARISGLSPQCISAFESEVNSPTVPSLIALSGALQVSVDYLLGLSDEFGGAPGSASSQVLSPDEEEILMLFRAMSKTQRTRLVAFGEGLLSGSGAWQKSLNRSKKA